MIGAVAKVTERNTGDRAIATMAFIWRGLGRECGSESWRRSEKLS